MSAVLERHMVPLPQAETVQDAAYNLIEYGYTRLTHRSLATHMSGIAERFKTLVCHRQRNRFVVEHPRELDIQGEQNLGLLPTTNGGEKKNPRPDEIAEGRTRYDQKKHTFHFNPRLLGYVEEKGGVPQYFRPFMVDLGKVHAAAVLLGYSVVEELDRIMPGHTFLDRFHAAEGEARTRVLRYIGDGKTPGKARRHRDKDFLTVHVRSDSPGLWLADRRNEEILDSPGEMSDDSVLLFFGRKAWQISRGKLPGIVHGVKYPPQRGPRHTLVTFLHAALDESDMTWGEDNMSDLTIPPHIDLFESTI